MSVRKTFALIYDGKVENTIDCMEGFEMANQIARCAFGDSAYAIDINQYATQIGDLYHDDSFWRLDAQGEEVEIPYIPTDEQKISALEMENENLINALEKTANELTDTQLALAEQYEENLILQEEITNTQLALTELYETSL